MEIKLTRVDGALKVTPAPPYILDYLQYTHRSFKTVQYQQVNDYERRLLYHTTEDGGIITFHGFFDKLCKMIVKHEDVVVVEDLRTPLPPLNLQAVKDINWAGIGSTGPRDYQFEPICEFLVKAQATSGIANMTGGWGKTVLQAVTYAAFDSLNTIVAIPLKQVFNQTYEVFRKLFPNKRVGRVGDGFHDISTDVTITTFRSLPRCATEKCQLLLVDELQSSTGNKILSDMMELRPIRVFGYTATDQNLFNNADKLLKGLFGERLVYISYDAAEEAGAVVPGLVYFLRTPDVIMNASTMAGKISQGIKSNKSRNQLVGAVCKAVPEGWQTLIMVDHIADHLVKLYPEMPNGTKFLHRGSSKKALGSFALTTRQQNETAEGFSKNEFQYLIATDAFRAGVDLPNCRVLVQASSGSSEIEVMQEALRVSRTLPQAKMEAMGATPKTHFVLIDFLDNHDPALESMAMKRMEYYKKQGWKIRQVNSVKDIDWHNYQHAE